MAPQNARAAVRVAFLPNFMRRLQATPARGRLTHQPLRRMRLFVPVHNGSLYNDGLCFFRLWWSTSAASMRLCSQ